MADVPSTEELSRIRLTLIWLILVVASAGLYDPNADAGLSDGAHFVLVVSFFVTVVYFVLIFIDKRTPDESDASGS